MTIAIFLTFCALANPSDCREATLKVAAYPANPSPCETVAKAAAAASFPGWRLVRTACSASGARPIA